MANGKDGMKRSEQGLSLTEVLITVSFTVIILSVAVPSVGKIRDGGRAEAIMAIAKDMGQAAESYYQDTGKLAIEFTASPDGDSYTHPRFHQLSMPQELAGWNGPYLEQPLVVTQNPYNSSIYLLSDLSAPPAHGFRLKRGDASLTKGKGQYIVFHGVPKRVARSIDSRLDKTAKNTSGWKEKGRVEWAPGGGGTLSILLLEETK